MLLDNKFSFRYKGRETLYKAFRITPNMFKVIWNDGETRYFENMVVESLQSGIWIKN